MPVREQLKQFTPIALLVFSLLFYSHLYFFDFDQGVSAAPAWIKSLKDVVLSLFIIWSLLNFKIVWPQKYLSLFFLILLLQISIGSFCSSQFVPILISSKNFILGLFAGYGLFLVFNQSTEQFKKIACGAILLLMLIQVIFSYFLAAFMPEIDLWQFSNASGFIGNPNTFATTLNLAIACSFCIFNSYKNWFIPLTFLIMGAGIVLSGSLSGLIIFILILVASALINSRIFLRSLTSIPLLIALVITLNVSKPEFFQYAVHRQLQVKIMNWLGLSDKVVNPEEESISFSYRRLQYQNGIKILESKNKFFAGALLIDGEYRVYDGQYLQLAVNHGVPVLMFFCIFSLFWLARSFLSRKLTDWDALLFLWTIVFGATQIFSHIWDYFPLSFLLWFTFFSVLKNKKSH